MTAERQREVIVRRLGNGSVRNEILYASSDTVRMVECFAATELDESVCSTARTESSVGIRREQSKPTLRTSDDVVEILFIHFTERVGNRGLTSESVLSVV